MYSYQLIIITCYLWSTDYWPNTNAPLI